MLSDYILPGSIIILKFGLRMTTDAETNGADTLRALMVFPIDIAFLSLSYGSAILYSSAALDADAHTIKAVLATAFIAVALLLPVIVLSKKAERAFVLAKHTKCTSLAAVGYLLALSITGISVTIGGLF